VKECVQIPWSDNRSIDNSKNWIDNPLYCVAKQYKRPG